MAIFTRTNGDAQPVFALDTQNGPVAANTSVSGQAVQPQGPKLDFFSLIANANLALQGDTNEFVGNVIQAVQQLATVAMYQVDGQQISLAIYPTGAYTTATLVAAAQTANAATIGIPTANVAGVGFKLATS